LARHLFGAGIGDFVVAPGGSVTVDGISGYEVILVPGTVIQFYDAPTAGTPVTDLEDLTFTAITTVTADTTGAIPQFYGPDTVRSMWGDANGGAGPRHLMIATDIGNDLATAEATIASLQAGNAALAAVANSGSYADLTGTPALATVAESGAYSDLSGTPAPGLQTVVKTGGSWPLRSTTAPDATRQCQWTGPEPAPPSGGGYALPLDSWLPVPT